MERLQGQVAKAYIRKFPVTGNNRRQASPQGKHICCLALGVVGVCARMWVRGFEKLQKRNSQALMSSSTSPSCPLSHQGTIPKSSEDSGVLAALLRATSLSQTITDRESTACRREALT